MANETSLPRQNSAITENNQTSREWYNFFRRLTDRVSAVENAPAVELPPPYLDGGSCVEITVQDATTARTLTADDDKVNVEFTNASAITVTVNADVMPENSVTYLTQGAAGQVTVVAGAGVTIDYSDSLKTRTQESMIGLKQIQLNKFELFGDAEPVAPARSALIRSANSVGAPAWVAPTADSQKLKRVSGALAWATDTASEIVNVPAGGIAATNVQTALNELDTEKANLASPTFTGTPTLPTGTIATTQTAGDSTTRIATTAFVTTANAFDLKRAPAVQAVTSAATVTAVTANDMVVITAQAVGLTLANPTGVFAQGQRLVYRIKDNGGAQTIAYGANFRRMSVALPITTVAAKTLYLYCEYNSTDTKFDVVRIEQEP